ncbi:glycoside hydrolase family 65 protein [Stigmatella aurantiaca]|uniref:Trehalose 6-phosphate phosphorylase n=1 Tax=Stigmatella aurantiaca (strain DW4/3-1) TaxID=378806 RepID=Q092D6_STIAD|nr:glycosyl hydrolase family 65 protein [Stigmatella aurantiaca]ADO69671.1 Trehalose 6-phosphate phosphorylase [Stigmatella aurantiaca DW4/3-1]EAU66618.1 trehalose 6-phosphate phosphorylase [Stigmatella aurantiaca DW4/3-1]
MRPEHGLFAYEGFEPEQEKLREALCTLGNGYFATRGAAPEAEADEVHYPGTYLAGGYNRLKTELAGRVVENEDLVNQPNWLSLSFRIEDGDWFNVSTVKVLVYRQVLDMAQGLLLRTVSFEDSGGRRTRVEQRRFVHMRHKHLAGQELVLVPENWSGRVQVRSALDGRVINGGVPRYRQLSSRHLRLVMAKEVDAETLLMEVETVQSRLGVAEAARTRLYVEGHRAEAQCRLIQEEGLLAHEFTVEVKAHERLGVEKVVALYSSKDPAVSEAAMEARHAVKWAPARFDELVATHVQAWTHLWNRSDLDLELAEPDGTHRALRLHIFHLLQTVSPHTLDQDAGVPARGWHGEAYRGHIFWDELFIFPFLNLRLPALTRALLRYRFRRLGRAREAAHEAGFRGAMFPWQSGSDGSEESPRVHLNPRSGRWLPDETWLQRHINAAVAYNIWQYYQATDDSEFLYFHGAEMLLELARFWASVAQWNPSLRRYEIKKVMGPDEYHTGYPDQPEPGLNNNTYTNLMAVWVLCKGLEVLRLMPKERREELLESLELEPSELAHWEDVSRKMRLVFHEDGVLSQFEGYEQLQEFDWEAYRARYGDIQRLDRILEAEGDSPNRYKLSKQADVLMLFYLFSSEELKELVERLGYPFELEMIPKTVDYYLQRTSHGSTLSGVVHSWVLARSDRPRSWKLFIEALQSDISDVQGGTTQEGIHLGAMAGTVDLVQRAYTGIEMRGDRLHFNPNLPEGMRRLKFSLRYRKHLLDVEITPETLVLVSRWDTQGPLKVAVRGERHLLRPSETRRFHLSQKPSWEAEGAGVSPQG